jgi:hypothetical protein
MKPNAAVNVPVLGAFLLALSGIASGALSGAMKSPAPVYNPLKEVRVAAVVAGIQEAPANSPLPGVHLTTQTDVDVYLGPSDFLDKFKTDIPIGAGVEVTGSTVKVGESEVFLARQVTEGKTTITLRDEGGAPVWDHWGAIADRVSIGD